MISCILSTTILYMSIKSSFKVLNLQAYVFVVDGVVLQYVEGVAYYFRLKISYIGR
jgi:hypothetical protein